MVYLKLIYMQAYTSILYLNPKMAIFIRGKRVQSIRVSTTLLRAKKYIYASKIGGVSYILPLLCPF